MTEDELIEAIRRLVADGEYLDSIPGIPGANLSGGGVFQAGPERSRVRRMYDRGSPEHLAARAQGLVDRLPALTPALPEAVAEAEAVLGHPLPSLLRRLYLEVGNGGFGPGYGLLGLAGGHRDDQGRTAIDQYRAWRSRGPTVPEGVLPVCHWGCAIYSLVDCRDADVRMWAWDPNPAPRDQRSVALFVDTTTLSTWFARWLDGKLWQPTLVQDEATGAWRGATDEEQEAWAAEWREAPG
jgi:SMI1/KNR4 family protein SUKH-1